MLAVATVNLGQLGIDLWLNTPSAEHVRDTLAFNIAGVLVGLPVWLLHWRWTERWARDSELERASTLRRLYLYAVLFSAIWALAYAAHEAIAAAVPPFMTSSTSSRGTLEAALDDLP